MKHKNKLISTLMIAGIAIASCAIAQNITGSGTNNYVLKFTGTSTAGNSSIFDNGNVGIGTTAPGSIIDAQAPSADIRVTSTTGTNQVFFRTVNTAGNFYMGLNNSIGNALSNAALPYAACFNHSGAYPINFAIQNKDVMTMLANGNVGIGIAAPAATLDVVAANAAFAKFSGAANGYLDFTEAGGVLSRLQNSGALYFGTVSNHDMNFKTNSTSKMTILAGGNVGIGTTTPFEKLHLHSGTGDGDAYNTVFALSRTSTTGNVEVAKLVLDDMDTNYGNLVFKVKTTASSAENAAYYTDAMTIKGVDGNVGIGTITPGAKLEVAGQVKITGGTPGAGKILVSDANGLASWSTVGANGGWSTTGNAGTVDGTNFVGTTDNIPFNIRVNNQKAGRIDQTLWNTFFGYQAGNANTTGNYTTAVGYQALYSNTTGYINTAFGYQSLYSNTTGIRNTANGFRALYNNTSGYENVANGYMALTSNTTGFYNTATGYHALTQNTSGAHNTAYGHGALAVVVTGTDNTALGYNAGSGGAFQSQCTSIGSGANLSTSRTNATILGYGIVDAQCTGNNQVCIGNTAIAAGGLRAAVTGWTAYSDARFKTNIKENVSGLDFILKLKPVTYNVTPLELHKIWGTPDSVVSKMDFSETEKETRIGFIAQEVEKAAKESGFNFPGIDVPRNDKEVYTLRYVDFIMPMIKGMQEQQTMIDILKTTTASLKDYINQQDSVISALKKQMDQFALSNNNAMQSLPSLNLTDVELNDKNVVVLSQNVPNPFSEQTTINYYLPDNVTRAQIVFFDQSGKIIKAVDLKEKGKGILNVFANDLSSGIYTYSLIIDGQTMETKKMIKTK